jgi:hypothetical protein
LNDKHSSRLYDYPSGRQGSQGFTSIIRLIIPLSGIINPATGNGLTHAFALFSLVYQFPSLWLADKQNSIYFLVPDEIIAFNARIY